MRSAVVALAIFGAVTLAASPAEARPGGGPGGDFGVGLMVGEPTGVSLQLGLGGPMGLARVGTALNFAIGLDLLEDNGFYGHVDYIWMLDRLIQGGKVSIPFYVGLGAFVADRGGTALGARMPFGAQLEFQTAPVQIFAEIALRLLLIDDVDLDVGGAIGFRYFF